MRHLSQLLYQAQVWILFILFTLSSLLVVVPLHATGVFYAVSGGAGARTGADWANALDLQAALLVADTGDQIWVKSGVYKPTQGTDRNVTFQLKSGVALYGGFAGVESALDQRNITAHPTILSGDLLGNDTGAASIDNPTRAENSYHVITATAVDGSTILNGITITAGNANRATAYWTPDSEGGGIRNNQSSPTIAHVIFLRNSAVWGGAMVNNNPSSPIISQDMFIDNHALYGGGLENFGGAPLISQTIFSGNVASICGAITNYGSAPVVSQSTFTNNIAVTPNSGGAICNVYLNNHLTVRNSIFWANIGGEIANQAGTADVQYSLVQGGYITGTQILDADPLFVDADGADNIAGTADDNLQLQPGSPAIDMGNDAFIPADLIDDNGNADTNEAAPFDQSGLPRIYGARVDMGAYEWQPVHLTLYYLPTVMR